MTNWHVTASAIVLGALLTGCATPNFPIEQPAGPPPPQADSRAPSAPQGEDAAPPAMPSERIQSGVLPPPAPRSAAPTATALPPVEPAYAPPPAYVAPAPRRAAAPERPAPRQAAGKVVTDAPPPVKVGKGDTLIAISRKTGVAVEILARANDLKAPYRLKPGQAIKLPAKRYYTVQSGDTLMAVARRFSVEAADLAEFNEFTGTSIRAGQKIYLPEGAKDKGPPPAPKPRPAPAPPAATRPVETPTPPPYSPPPYSPPPYRPPAYTPPVSAPPAYTPPPVAAPPAYTPPTPPPVRTEPAPPPTPRAPIPYRQTNPSPTTAPMRPQMPEVSVPPTDSEIAAAGRGRFVWPVRGDVLSRFGPTGGGQRNDGINISASPGEGVRAAAQGEVVYAGNQVPGFGNLVLIKHDGGWVTAYAHLANIDVKMRQAITQGQVIGQAGQTGSVDQPQLHFEIRYAPSPKDKARPVDPMLVLPR